MKKLLIILATATLIGCTSEDLETKDCNCNRVVEVSTFGTIGTIEDPAMRYFSVFVTINDCSGVQRSRNHNTTNIDLVPKVGECR
jgi:hypothetical protein